MTWSEHHTRSERFAAQAELAARAGDDTAADALYRHAAAEELVALDALPKDKTRTLGITAVSAVSLWLVGHDFRRAEQTAFRWLDGDALPEFAVRQLRDLLQRVWGEQMRSSSPVTFLPGDVSVSVSGGQVLYGAAPLDLILTKVEEVKAIVIRTIEMKLGEPFRRGRAAASKMRDLFEPWIVQQPAGSYQFAVRIRTPSQLEMFTDQQLPEIGTIATTALDVLRASVDDPEEDLARLVPNADYRMAFLKLARNLAPTGKSFGQISLGSATAAAAPVVMLPAARANINDVLRSLAPKIPPGDESSTTEIRGVLRGLSLNRDWLELTVTDAGGEQREVRVFDAGESLDDVIGPMVNRRVIVEAFRKKRSTALHLRDIQPEE